MFPTQDHRQGNSVFVDENWNAYYDQWKLLRTIHQLSKNEIEEYIYKWKE